MCEAQAHTHGLWPETILLNVAQVSVIRVFSAFSACFADNGVERIIIIAGLREANTIIHVTGSWDQ